MESNTDLFEIRSSKTGHGAVGINTLGWDAQDGYVACARPLDNRQVISAHAPSVVEMYLKDYAEVFSFMNGTATMNIDAPVSFWATGNYMGMLEGPCECGRTIILPPGRHLLQAAVHGTGKHDWRHAMWALRRYQRPELADTDECLPQNTAVVTATCYTDEELPSKVLYMARSAAKRNIYLHAMGQGHHHVSFMDTKVTMLRSYLDTLPAHCKYVLYVDARDSVFLGTLDEICRTYQSMGGGIVIGAERDCWPARDAIWASLWPDAPHGRRFINAGVFMGPRKALCDALDVLTELCRTFAVYPEPEELYGLRDYRGFRNDDQFLWQSAVLLDRVKVNMDYSARLICNNLNHEYDQRIAPVNRDFEFKGTRLIIKETGVRPTILHYPGISTVNQPHQAGVLNAIYST